MDEKYDVWQFFTDGTRERVRLRVEALEAVEAFHHYTHSVAAQMGMVESVIIVDGGDMTCAEWTKKDGVVFPPPMKVH